MDAKNYREVISNPWSWSFESNHLYFAANDLYELYTERLESERKYFKEKLEADNKRIEEEIKRLEVEIKSLKEGKGCIEDPNPWKVDYGQIVHDQIGAYGQAMSSESLLSLPNLKSYTHIIPVYMMLMGMAIENIAKGIKVARELKKDITVVDKASLKNLGIFGHSAPSLIKDLGIILTDKEEKLLNDANEHLEWAGRYAAPSKIDKDVLPETIMDMTIAEIEDDVVFGTLNTLYKRLSSMFEEEVEDPSIENIPWQHSLSIWR